MAIWCLNIGNEPKIVQSKQPGKKDFVVFRAAENQGENREPIWYDVVFFPPDPLDGDLLSKGQYIEVFGRIDARLAMTATGELYRGPDGMPKIQLRILTGKVNVIEKKAKPPQSPSPE